MGSAQPLEIETRPSGAFQLEVAEVIAETHDSCSLVLRVPAELQERFRYKPGQYLGFRVALGGKRLTRCYSLSSSPHCDAQPTVTIKRVDGGRVSNWFNDQVRPGDRLEVLPPAGHFHLRPGEHDLVLFGGGSGITPVFSILKSALRTSVRRIKLVYANRDEASVIFRDELCAIAREHIERLEVVHVLDSVQGFLDQSQVRQLVRGHAGAEFYICGPGPFMDTVERALLGLGEDAARIHVERFVSPPDPDANEPVALPAAAAVECLLVELDGQLAEVPVQPGETLLQSCRAAGLDVPSSCEEGFCGACMCQVEEGEVLLARNDILSPAELAEGWTLACQGRPGSARLKLKFPD
ncbi:3-ketosteroid 9alpha-monooxygenase subunit B [Pseudomonas sp. SLBN-26]|uniref:ferredoxin--NADP reductase n=1 Tax=Pseudomonadaceae TaxID=135621 RepID=UPI00114ED355|nr:MULTISPECIES: ferredoxin--NADP reductase [Pseudomonas]MCP1618093.1 3-ketosteroid 9alpha-monooxygenase subunit B [Pseudomonas otitidis]TQL07331.1 3-ketosteroid 9alpha-monooxygenase subunit B [Pseudomonas sp. SLBN-26]